MHEYQVEYIENRLDHTKKCYNIKQPVTEPVFKVTLFLSTGREYLRTD